jgi:type VI secretion system protein ImpH
LEFRLDYRKKLAHPAEERPAAESAGGPGGRNGEWTRRTSDWPKLYFAGRLACPTRNAEGLQAIIEDYFQLPAAVLTFFGRYIALPSACVCRLGRTPDASLMGQSLFAGESIWDCQMSFRLRLGPMTLADFERMLPGGAGFERLKRWVFEYLSYELSWDVQLILRKDEVPETTLGSAGRLGWTTFLKSQPFERDADSLVVTTEE